jgi:hypothetical protein
MQLGHVHALIAVIAQPAHSVRFQATDRKRRMGEEQAE